MAESITDPYIRSVRTALILVPKDMFSNEMFAFSRVTVRVKTYGNTSKLDEVQDSSTFDLVLH